MVSDTIMNNIQLSTNKTLFYDKEIRLEYKLKITKTEYENKDNNQLYVRYKIKIPEEIRKLLRYQKYLYFTTENDIVHIKTSCKEYMHRTRIQKYRYNKCSEYSLYLSKKVFNINSTYFYWKVIIEDNHICDTVAMIV